MLTRTKVNFFLITTTTAAAAAIYNRHELQSATTRVFLLQSASFTLEMEIQSEK